MAILEQASRREQRVTGLKLVEALQVASDPLWVLLLRMSSMLPRRAREQETSSWPAGAKEEG